MEELIIPPNPNWFAPSICQCTPDNGLIYAAMTKIVYIPPKSSADKTKIFDLKQQKICSFSINPNWNESKIFAVFNDDLQVLIYDFNSGSIITGHKGHDKDKNSSINHKTPTTAISFLRQNAVLSSVNSNVIYFCLASNSFKIYVNLSSRNPITVFQQSPKDSNLVAAGTKNGLILLIALERMEVLTKLRGHDTEISSLDWFYFSKKSAMEKVSLQNLIADSSDCFDIYEDRHEVEFGVVAGDEDGSDDEVTEPELKEKIVENANFNFLEACKNLKDEILQENHESLSKTGKFEDNQGQYELREEKCQSTNDSINSNASSRTPHLTSESDELQDSKDFVIVNKEDVKMSDEIPILASGAREQVVWLWNVDEKVSIDKISWHPKSRPALPSPFTNVAWLNQQTLLVTNGNGDIMEFEINFDYGARKVKSKENKDRKFDTRGVLNFCKSNDSKFLWTSSIHRQVNCLDLVKNEKIISLDTIQLKIHRIVENPFDSNLIAISGNDKRICLWNTSETSREQISLRPFMNKMHCAVLSLQWHPEKENLLAFSTREGRCGILDVNKSTNVPIILPHFTSKEVYAIEWIKIGDEVNLVACDRQKFFMFSQKSNWKFKTFDHLKESGSILVVGEVMVVGTDNGEILLCKIDENFSILTKIQISKKYIGSFSSSGSSLAIPFENGFYLVKNFTPDVEEFKQENFLHFSKNARIFGVKFNKLGNLAVSYAVDGLVQVWDIEKVQSIASFAFEFQAFYAIFLPSDESFLICGGQDSTVLTIKWENYHEFNSKIPNSKKKGKSVNWATPTEVTTISKSSQKRQSKKIEKVEIEENLTQEMLKISLNNKKSSPIFTAANRELTVNPLEFIEKCLDAEGIDSFNEQMFGDRTKIKEIIQNEMENNQNKSIVLPQLSDSLKDDILSRIASKTLTEVHVAIAPSVSFDIWKKSCLAFAMQNVENGESIKSIPYFLAVNEINKTIQSLCEGKYFREAWIVAKMRKFDGDPMFNQILEKWLEFLNSSGNYEAAAALLVCKKDFKKAAEFLEKRQNKTDKCYEILKLLNERTNGD